MSSVSSRNLPLMLLRWFFTCLLFFFSVWYIFETRYASPAMLGLIYGIAQLVTIVLEIPTGYFADRWGRRQAMLLGLFLQAMSWFILGSTVSVGYLWVGYMVNSVGAAFLSGAATAFDYDSLKQDGREKEFSKWISIANFLASLAIVIGILVGGKIFGVLPRWTYYGHGLANLAALIAVLFAFEPKDSDGVKEIDKTVHHLLETFKGIWSNLSTRYLALFYVVVSGLAYSYIFVFAMAYAALAYSDDMQRSYVLAGVIVAVSLIVLAITPILIRNKSKSLYWWGGILVVGYLGAGLTSTLWVPVFLVLMYIAHDLRGALVDQFMNEAFPSKFRASLLSVLNLGTSIIVFVTLIIGMYFVEKFGMQPVFVAIGVLGALILAVLGIKMGRKEREFS